MKVKSKLSDTANNYLKHTKKQKGITLIALVITIIVLLILAGVTISALSGDNGILTNASKARKQTEIEEIREKIKQSGKKQIVIAGLETHLCVLQTALDLQKEGYEVFVAADACSSRNAMQSALGVQRLLHNGVDVVTVEMAIFEWLENSRSPEFKEVWAKRI